MSSEGVDAAVAVLRADLEDVPDVGDWLFINLSRHRLPHWSAERRRLGRLGIDVEPFAWTPVSDVWRWAEPAAHGDIELAERPRARCTPEVLDRLTDEGRPRVRELLRCAPVDDGVQHAVVRLLDDGREVTLLARGVLRHDGGRADLVVGFAVAPSS